MATIYAEIEIEEGKSISDYKMLRLGDQEFVAKPYVYEMVMGIVKKEIEAGRLSITSGHENHFKRLMNGEYTNESTS